MDASQLQGVSLIKNLHSRCPECQSKEMIGAINRQVRSYLILLTSQWSAADASYRVRVHVGRRQMGSNVMRSSATPAAINDCIFGNR